MKKIEMEFTTVECQMIISSLVKFWEGNNEKLYTNEEIKELIEKFYKA